MEYKKKMTRLVWKLWLFDLWNLFYKVFNLEIFI